MASEQTIKTNCDFIYKFLKKDNPIYEILLIILIMEILFL